MSAGDEQGIARNWCDLAVSAARAAGKELLGAFGEPDQERREDGRDVKAGADRVAEAVLVGELESSGLPILSEESGWILEASGQGRADWGLLERGPEKVACESVWVIDPLDGTYNFLQGIPLCCVSVALWENGAPTVGVVYDFVRDECFSGGKRLGAWCNGEPIAVSRTIEASRAGIAMGFPNARDYGEESLHATIAAVQKYKKVRMLGSAALSLAYVAAGRLDRYEEEDIYLWDVAAGLALVVGAGGRSYLKAGRSATQVRVGADNGRLEEKRREGEADKG